MPDSAVVQIGLQLYSDNSDLCNLPGFKDKVVAMMMAHNAKPSLFYMHADSFAAFLSHAHSVNNDLPETLDQFEKRYEMRFVMASFPPVEEQIAYARGAYVKLQLVSKVIEVFDSYFAWRYENQIGGAFPEVEVHISNGTGVKFSSEEEYECKIVIEEVEKKVIVPFGPLAIPGHAWSKLHAEIRFEVLNKTELRIRFQGDTYSFRNNFVSLGVYGRFETQNGEPLPEDAPHDEKKRGMFVRIIKRIDVSQEEKANFLLQMIADTVYENTIVAVHWKGNDQEGNKVSEFKMELKKLGNVYFKEEMSHMIAQTEARNSA